MERCIVCEELVKQEDLEPVILEKITLGDDLCFESDMVCFRCYLNGRYAGFCYDRKRNKSNEKPNTD